MGTATSLENIRWRANLLLDGGEGYQPDEIGELIELIIGLVDAIERRWAAEDSR